MHALIDRDRTLHIASLYATRGSSSGDETVSMATWNYTLALWKFDQEARRLDYGSVLDWFEPLVPGAVIDTHWLLEIPETGQVALVWRESSPTGSPVPTGSGAASGWMRIALTSSDVFDAWLGAESPIALACDESTNPVVVEARIVFLCDNGPHAVGDIAPNATRVIAYDVLIGAAETLGDAPFPADGSALAARPDGKVALAYVKARTKARELDAAGATNATAPRLPLVARIATADAESMVWSQPHDFAAGVHNASLKLSAARITAALYSPRSDTIHLILQERASAREIADGEPAWRKTLAVVDPIGTVLLRLDLAVSEKGEALGTPVPIDAAGDTRDSLILVADREYIAFADFGVVVFAELVEQDSRVALPPSGSPPPPPQPVPAVQTSALVSTSAFVAAAGVSVAAARLAASRLARHEGAGRGRP